jgi:hypothetical protein
VAAVLIVSVTALEVLAVKFASPLYFAVMECEPTASVEIVNCALLLKSVAEPKELVPSRKVIVPVALPLYAGATLAVKVSDWPKAPGLALEETVAVVEAWFTVSVNGKDVLPV